jgi:outer membrane immunogenic protein
MDFTEGYRNQLHPTCQYCVFRRRCERPRLVFDNPGKADEPRYRTRARAGTLVSESLWYVTGGFAWGTVKDNDAFNGFANPVIFPGALQPGPFLPSAASFSATRTGWTVGAGVETKLGGGWSAKLEYLFVDLGTLTQTYGIAINPAFGPAFTTGGVASVTSSLHITDNIVRAGLNYKFF